MASCVAFLIVAGSARAQDSATPGGEPSGEPSAQQRQAAAEAYDRGTAAYLSHDYAAAAQWFETANRMAPALPALLQAVRAHDRGGNALRAANLALRLHAQYGSDAQASRVADPLIASGDRHYVRVDVTCAGCTVDLDGTLQESLSFYLEPGAAHAVVAHFDTGSVDQRVSGAAGDHRALSLTAPPPPPPENDGSDTTPPPTHGWPASARRHAPDASEDATRSTGDAHPDHAAPPPASGGGMSPVVFGIGAAVTAIAGGLLIWSGVDTLGGVDAYRAMPTLDAYNVGHDKELRTDVLIGVTAGLAAGTLILALLTDWGGHADRPPASAEPAVQAAIVPVPGGIAAAASGRF